MASHRSARRPGRSWFPISAHGAPRALRRAVGLRETYAAQTLFEPLEERRVLSLVTWDGGAGTASWNDALNWSSDTLPTSVDDVAIPTGSPSPITFAANAQANNLVSDRAIQLSSGRTLTVGATARMNADFTLSGGTISGGVWSFGGSGALQLTTGGGTIAGANLGTDIALNASNEYVRLSGSTRFATARLSAGSTRLEMAPGYTLRDDVLVEGTVNSTAEIRIAFGGAGTVTFAPDATITLAAGTALGLKIIQSSAGSLLNNQGLIAANAAGEILEIYLDALTNEGTIQATAGTLHIFPTTWSSSGALTASDATLNLNGAWSNSGAITVTNSTVNLDGTFTTAGLNLPAWIRSGGTVNITGALSNAAGTLTLNAATGTWQLFGGSISGGTLAFADGSELEYSTFSDSTLTDVNVLGDIPLDGSSETVTLSGSTRFVTARLSVGSVTLGMAPGYTLHDDVLAEGVTNGTATIRIAVGGGNGTVTFAPDATVTLAAGASLGLDISQGNTGNLINQGLIAANAAGEFLRIVGLNTLTNEGIILATAGTLHISPAAWSSSGAITASDSTLRLGGAWSHTGTVSVIDSTLYLGGTFTTAGLNLPAWTRSGGTVNITGALGNAAATLTLNAATGPWRLFAGSISGGTLAFAGGALLDYSTLGGTLTDVNILGDISLDADFENVKLAGSTRFVTARLSAGSASLGMAPGYTLHDDVLVEGATDGTARIRIAIGGAGTATFAPDATVTLATGTGLSLNIDQSSDGTLLNQGLITANAAGEFLQINLNTFTNEGTIQATAGTLSISPTTLTNVSAGTLSGGTWIVSNATLTTAGGAITTNAATVEYRGVGSWSQIDSIAVNEGFFTLEDGRDLATPGPFTNNGSLTLGPGSRLTVNGDFVQTAGSSIEVRASGSSDLTGYGSVGATGSAAIDGAYTAAFVGGYVPTQGTFFDVVSGAAGRSGTFASVSLPTPPTGDKTLLIYEGTRVRMLSTDLADVDVDGNVNTQDFLLYLNWFTSSDSSADFNNDGQVNALDFLVYLNLWADS